MIPALTASSNGPYIQVYLRSLSCENTWTLAPCSAVSNRALTRLNSLVRSSTRVSNSPRDSSNSRSVDSCALASRRSRSFTAANSPEDGSAVSLDNSGQITITAAAANNAVMSFTAPCSS